MGAEGLWSLGGVREAAGLSAVLRAAEAAAATAGVTRLAELTGLDDLGFPIFQAIRPRALSLSTSLGRGATPRAAMVSALLEAVETDLAERIAPVGDVRPLAALGGDALRLWSGAARDRRAIRLDPARPRLWLDGTALESGERRDVPFDLVSLDLTRTLAPDAMPTTVGLATGGSRVEALASAVAELLEHDLEADWRRGTPEDKRRCELDLANVDHPAVRAAIDRVTRTGRELRLWSLGQDAGIAAILCSICDSPASATALPPTGGGGVHPDRAVAALRAISEAAQARAALISGARDDFDRDTYADAAARRVELILASLSFSGGPLGWRDIPTREALAPQDALQMLHDVATARTDLPLVVVDLPSSSPHFHVVKVVAPGLLIAERQAPLPSRPPLAPRARPRLTPGRRLLFVGPTLCDEPLPPGLERRPPAMAGDLAALLDDPPEAIGLIDGRFETAPSVWHKEIIDLLACGVTILGAASLGALRAAELCDHGMHGVGTIFDAYRTGALRRDDAVMIVHAPAELGCRPLSLALVEAEAALDRIELPAAERRMLQRIARTLPFRERSWTRILGLYRERTRTAPSISEAMLAAMPSPKCADALELVARLAGTLPPAPIGPRPPLTCYYRALLEQSLSRPSPPPPG